MKKLRGHTLKIWVILLVCSGLSMAAANPALASGSSNEFANWLQSLAKKTSAPEVEQKLKSLKHQTGDLNRLIEQASQIVSSNNDDFNLPRGTASDNIQHILLLEWNQFQSGNAMAAIPSAETLKPNLAPQHQKTLFSDTGLPFMAAKKITLRLTLGNFFSFGFIKSLHIIPLISGIAIGAP
jgi:hypothetical protein